MTMAIKTDEYNGVLVFAPSADLLSAEADELRKLAEAALSLPREHANVVLDFEKVGFVDSEALEAMLWLKRRCDDLFGSLKLASLDENVRKILEITRLDHRFDCHVDLPTALKNAH